jgi:molybdate transport system substrate-binding protein
MRRSVWILVMAALLVSCSAGGRAELLVSAAASLTDAFAAIEAAYEAANPDVDVVLNLGGSSALREQILAGAPADVFAAANEATMRDVATAGLLLGPAEIFATNRLTVAVPRGNPAGITGLDDFGRSELLIGLCAVGVPCGDLARTALERTGVTPDVDTNEPNVRSLLTKIELGDLDAGIVYVTDVVARSARVDEVPIADRDSPTARYPIAVLAESAEDARAVDFVSFVLSAEGSSILAEQGFGVP